MFVVKNILATLLPAETKYGKGKLVPVLN